MSADQLGASLLADVQEESLDQILAELRQIIEPTRQSSLGQSELDRLIEALQPPIAEQHHATPGRPRPDDDPDDEDFQYHDDVQTGTSHLISSNSKSTPLVIELTSSASSSGKTSLLYLLSAIAILPQDTKGKESTIVWLDTDARFSASRLHQVCLSYLSDSAPTLDQSICQILAKEALEHVHVFPIQSSTQLLQTLETIPSYLLRQQGSLLPKHHSSPRALSLLILDSAQSFTWPDRFADEIARLEAYGTSTSASTSIATSSSIRTSKTIHYLKEIQSRFECSILYTTSPTLVQQPFLSISANTSSHQAIPSTTNPQTPNRPNIQRDESSDPHPLSQWTQAATLSLTFSRIKVPQFASQMSLEECLRDKESREAVVRKGRMRVWVTESWLDRVVRDKEAKERVLTLKNRGAFTMEVDGDGVRVER